MKNKLLLTLLPVAMCGCTHQIETKSDINLKPIEIKPIHITLDVNVKVDKALDSSFNEVDKAQGAVVVGKPGELTPVVTDAAPEAKPAATPAVKPENPVKDAALVRIKERLPKVEALKTSGMLGESNTGFLGLIKANPEAKALAETENGDRWTVYQEIAKQKGTTPDMVAKRRALRNIEKATVGTWVQGTDGKWAQKK